MLRCSTRISKAVKIASRDFHGNLRIFKDDFEYSQKEYLNETLKTVDRVNNRIQEIFDDKNIVDPDYDSSMSSDGVLQMSFGTHGTFIVSRQTPKRELWLSSPKTGPWHYKFDHVNKDWICSKGNDRFWDRLNKEISPILGEETGF